MKEETPKSLGKLILDRLKGLDRDEIGEFQIRDARGCIDDYRRLAAPALEPGADSGFRKAPCPPTRSAGNSPSLTIL